MFPSGLAPGAWTYFSLEEAITADTPITTPLSVTSHPSDQTVCDGSTATFTASASGTPPPTTQWQVSTDGGSTWNDVSGDRFSGAASNTLSFPAASGDNAHKYRAAFTNGSGTVYSNAATLTVRAAPTVTTNPTNQTVLDGHTATFTAAASGNPGVQWQVSTNGETWSDVSGANSTTLSFTAHVSDTGKKYRAVFSNGCGTPATTSPATLTVSDPLPTISDVSATPNPLDEGGSTTLSVTAVDPAGIDTLAYEFDCNNDGTYEVGPQAGSSASCPFPDSGSYTVGVRVSDDDGPSTSTKAITVTNIAPTAILSNDGPVAQGFPVTVSLTGATDPSPPDTSAGFHYAFDCNGASLDAATYASAGSSPSTHCVLDTVGTNTVRGAVIDKDNGKTVYTTDVTVTQLPADLQVSEHVNDSSASPGQTLTFSITVANLGPGNAYDVQLTDTFPTGVSVLDVTPSQGSCTTGQTVSCSFGKIAKGDKAFVTVHGKVGSTGDQTDSTFVSGSGSDPNSQNNSSAQTVHSAAFAPPGGPVHGEEQGLVLVNGVQFTGGAIPYGATITIKPGGSLKLTSDVGEMVFYPPSGDTIEFVLSRTASTEHWPASSHAAKPFVEATILGKPTGCTGKKAPDVAGAKTPPKPKSLWGHGKGHYKTKGSYGAAAVRGTWWFTQDRCDGTYFFVRQGVVDVFDFAKHKHILVGAGKSYLAKKP